MIMKQHTATLPAAELDHAPAATPGSWRAVRAGAEAILPFALSTLLFGVMYGTAAAAAGMPAAQAIASSLIVNAGGAQFAALGLWTEPLPVAAMMLSAMLICSRYLLFGMAVEPHLKRLHGPRRWAALHVLSDAPCLLTIARGGEDSHRFFAGGGLAMFLAWVGGTVLGLGFSGLLDARTIAALGFAGPMFIGVMLVISARTTAPALGTVLAWAAAGGVALILSWLSQSPLATSLSQSPLATVVSLSPAAILPLAVAAGALVRLILLEDRHD